VLLLQCRGPFSYGGAALRMERANRWSASTSLSFTVRVKIWTIEADQLASPSTYKYKYKYKYICLALRQKYYRRFY